MRSNSTKTAAFALPMTEDVTYTVSCGTDSTDFSTSSCSAAKTLGGMKVGVTNSCLVVRSNSLRSPHAVTITLSSPISDRTEACFRTRDSSSAVPINAGVSELKVSFTPEDGLAVEFDEKAACRSPEEPAENGGIISDFYGSKLKQANEKRSRLKSCSDSKKTELAAVMSECEALEADNKALEAKLEELKRQCESARFTRKTVEEQINALSAMIKTYEEASDALLVTASDSEREAVNEIIDLLVHAESRLMSFLKSKQSDVSRSPYQN